MHGPLGDSASFWAWEPLRPRDVAELLDGFDAPWWIAGGWALDLFLDDETRRHDDVDVAVLRRDQLTLYRWLAGWDLRYATPERTLEPWDGRPLEPPVHGVWARRSPGTNAAWTCEFLLNEERDGRWVFRRNAAITRALGDLGAKRNGLPFLRPEVVLLYKSKEPTPKDENDFAVVQPHLSEPGRLWLRRALEVCDARHPWLERLSTRSAPRA